MSLEKITNENTMLAASPPRRAQSDVPAAVELLGDLSELGLAPAELPDERCPVRPPEMKPRMDELAEQVQLMEQARIEEILFKRAEPACLEDVRYVSEAIGDVIRG